MKKILACLSAIVILVSALLVGVMPTFAGESASAPIVFADYTTRAKYEAAADIVTFSRYGGATAGAATDDGNGNTKAYSDAKGALLFTTVGDTTGGTRKDLGIFITPTTDKRLLLKDVNVVAIKSEIADPDTVLYFAGVYVNGLNNENRQSFLKVQVTSSFIFLTVDHEAAREALGDGYDTAVAHGYAIHYNSTTYPENGTTITVQWAGVFDSVAAAEDYFDVENVDPSVVFADYTTRAKYEAAADIVTFSRYGGATAGAATDDGNGNTKAYSDAKGALLFTTVGKTDNSNRKDMGVYVTPTADKRLLLKDVNVVAIKSQIADPSTVLYASGVYVNGLNNGDRKGFTTVQITDSFIFLIVDHDKAKQDLGDGYDTALAHGYAIFYNSMTYPENGTTITVEWAGVFDSVWDAEAYFNVGSAGSTTPSTGTSTSAQGSTSSTNAGSSAQKPVPFFYSYKTENEFNEHVGQALPDQNVPPENIADNLIITNRADGADFVHHTFAYEWGLNAGGNTVLSYDPTIGAMKVTVKETYTGENHPGVDYSSGTMDSIWQPGKLVFAAENDVTATMGQYKVFAVKIKLANANYVFNAGSTLLATNGTSMGGFAPSMTASDYAETTDWQLLILNVPQNESIASKKWQAVMFSMIPNGTAVEAGQELGWIEWVGAFATAADAQAYFADPNSVTNTTTTTTMTAPVPDENPILVDFSSQDKYNANSSNIIIGTDVLSLSYDEAGGAKISNVATEFVDQDQGRYKESWIKINPARQVSAVANEVIVAKVKVSSENMLTYSHRAYYGAGANDYVGYAPGNHTYKIGDADVLGGDGDWVYVAYTSEAGVGSAGLANNAKWGQLWIIGHGSKFVPDDTFTIAWVGAFESMEAAYTYVGLTPPSTTSSKPIIVTSTTTRPTGISTDNPVLPDDGRVSSDFFFDFGTEDRFWTYLSNYGQPGKLGVAAATNSSLITEFDEEEKAMKIRFNEDPYNEKYTEPGSLIFTAGKDAVDDKMTDYPYIGIKIKLNSKYYTFSGGNYPRNYFYSWAGVYRADENPYAANTNWQLLLLTKHEYYEFLAGSDPDDMNWKGLMLHLFSNTDKRVADGDVAWIAWAGAFATPEDAQNYFEATTEIVVDDTPPYYIDLSTEDDYDFNVNNKKFKPNSEQIALEYDSTVGGVKVTALEDITSNIGALVFLPQMDSCTMDDYPVFAIKVKLANKNTLSPSYGMFAANAYSSGFNSGLKTNEYQETDDWQLLVLRGSIAWNVKFTGYWKGIIATLARDGESFSAGDTIAWVQWAGAFKSEIEAYNYAGLPMGEVKEAPSEFFVDFLTKDSAGALAVGNDKTSLTYTATEGAMLVKPSKDEADAGSVIFNAPEGSKTAVSDYPYFAMRVKLLNTESKFGKFFWRTTKSDEARAKNSDLTHWQATDGVTLTYAPQEEWQLVYVDLSEVDDANFDGDWTGVMLNMFGEGSTAADNGVYIDWMGAFESLDQIYEYAGIDPDFVQAPTKVFWDLSSENSVNTNVEVAGDTEAFFDYDMGALKIVAIDKDGDGVVATTPGRIILGSKYPLPTGLETTEHVYVALRVKISKQNQFGGDLYARSSGTIENYVKQYAASADQLLTRINYKNTGNWQTIVFKWDNDSLLKFFFTGNWDSLQINALSDVMSQEGDAIWIRWAGAFKTEQDVLDYLAATKGNEYGDSVENDWGGSGDDVIGNTPTGEKSASPLVISLLTLALVTMIVLFSKKRKTSV